VATKQAVPASNSSWVCALLPQTPQVATPLCSGPARTQSRHHQQGQTHQPAGGKAKAALAGQCWLAACKQSPICIISLRQHLLQLMAVAWLTCICLIDLHLFSACAAAASLHEHDHLTRLLASAAHGHLPWPVLPRPPCMSETTPAEPYVLPRPPCKHGDPERALHSCWQAGGWASARAADRAGSRPQPPADRSRRWHPRRPGWLARLPRAAEFAGRPACQQHKRAAWSASQARASVRHAPWRAR